MEYRFGRVLTGVMHPNPAGEMVASIWQHLPGRFPGIELDVFVVIPNHFHGIIFIGTEPTIEPPSLVRVLQAFKSGTAMLYTRGVHSGNYPRYKRSLWHGSFHDKILPNEQALEAARAYVLDNPRAWQENHDRQREESRAEG
jgi:hypothetical protein